MKDPNSEDLAPLFHPSSFRLPPSEDDRPLVLVADDNADMRHYVARLLSELTTSSRAGWETALARSARQLPDLILTDVMMPRLDGFGLLSQLAPIPHGQVPVIMLSARAGEESRVEGHGVRAPTTISSSRSVRVSCWPAFRPTCKWLGCGGRPTSRCGRVRRKLRRARRLETVLASISVVHRLRSAMAIRLPQRPGHGNDRQVPRGIARQDGVGAIPRLGGNGL